jgi:hypothetical protein
VRLIADGIRLIGTPGLSPDGSQDLLTRALEKHDLDYKAILSIADQSTRKQALPNPLPGLLAARKITQTPQTMIVGSVDDPPWSLGYVQEIALLVKAVVRAGGGPEAGRKGGGLCRGRLLCSLGNAYFDNISVVDTTTGQTVFLETFGAAVPELGAVLFGIAGLGVAAFRRRR